MLFTLCILIFAVATALIPLLVLTISKIYKIRIYTASPLLPLLAAVLFIISFYLPTITISPETNTFQQHFVGGGIYSALLYIYIAQLLGKRHVNLLLDTFLLFAWVSTLGVANKLIEFVLFQSGLMALDMSDAYWDLLANTLGALTFYYIVFLLKKSIELIRGRHQL